MIAVSITGILALDAKLVRVKDRDYISTTMNAARPKEDAVWVSIMYYTKNAEPVLAFLKKGARIHVVGTRYTDKIYEGKNGHGIDRCLWADALDIVHFVEPSDDLPR